MSDSSYYLLFLCLRIQVFWNVTLSLWAKCYRPSLETSEKLTQRRSVTFRNTPLGEPQTSLFLSSFNDATHRIIASSRVINEIFEKTLKEIFAIETLGWCKAKPRRTSVRIYFPHFFINGTSRIHNSSAGYWYVALFKSLDCVI